MGGAGEAKRLNPCHPRVGVSRIQTFRLAVRKFVVDAAPPGCNDEQPLPT